MLHEGRAGRTRGQAAWADIFTCWKFSRDTHNLRAFHLFEVLKNCWFDSADAVHLFLFVSHLERFLELPLKLRFLIFPHAEKRSRSWLHLHRDRFGEQLHSTKERSLRGLVHGLHPPWAPQERLPDTAAPTWGPLHEEATKGAAAGPPEPPPSFRFHPLPVQSKD